MGLCIVCFFTHEKVANRKMTFFRDVDDDDDDGGSEFSHLVTHLPEDCIRTKIQCVSLLGLFNVILH